MIKEESIPICLGELRETFMDEMVLRWILKNRF